MMPKPPIWMSSRITTCPNGLQWVAVSTTTRPVTQAALVAVKSASMKRRRGATGRGDRAA